MRNIVTRLGNGVKKDFKKGVCVKIYDDDKIVGTLRIEFDTQQPKASVSMLADMVLKTIDDWQDLCVALSENINKHDINLKHNTR